MNQQVTLADVASIIIAVAALATAVWSGVAARRHNRLSVIPRLRINHRFRHSTDFLGIRIANAGLGPAIVTSIELLLDEQPVHYSHQGWSDALGNVGLLIEEWAITRLLTGTVTDGRPAPAADPRLSARRR